MDTLKTIMPDLSIDDIKQAFGSKTFSRGLEYYEEGNVLSPIKIESGLYARVIGTAAEPYEVRADIKSKTVSTSCSCPVGFMCKHGAALLLKWIKEPSSFSYADKFLSTLSRMDKEELIGIIKKLITHDPSLVDFCDIGPDDVEKVDIQTICRRIERIAGEALDEYRISDAVTRLREIKRTADRLADKGVYKAACDMYLALVEGCVWAYKEGSEDPEQELWDLATDCVEAFNESAPKIVGVQVKNEFLKKILDLENGEDYDINTQEMILGISCKENLCNIEGLLLDRSKKENSGTFYSYKKDDALRLLSAVYDKLGMQDEALKAIAYELNDKGDYVRLAEVQSKKGMLEEAMTTLKNGAKMPGEDYRLHNLYFDIALLLIDKNPGLIDYESSFKLATDMLNRRFDTADYRKIKNIFKGIGRLEEFKDEIRKRLISPDDVIDALMDDGDVKEAASYALAHRDIDLYTLETLAKKALDKGMRLESARLTKMAMEMDVDPYGFWGIDQHKVPAGLADNIVKTLDGMELAALCGHIIKKRLKRNALELALPLAKKYPELTVSLVKAFMDDMPVDLVADIARAMMKKLPDKAIELCMNKASADVNYSHARYDEAIKLLKDVKGIYEAKGDMPGWRDLIHAFKDQHRGKKKLIEKMKKAHY